MFKSRQIGLWVAIALGVLALTLCTPVLKRLVIGWVRYNGVNKVLIRNDAMALAKLVPMKKSFDHAVSDGHLVDLGYARFNVNEEEAPTSSKVTGEKGTTVALECKNFMIVFLNPSPRAGMDAETRHVVEISKRDYPKLTAFMQLMTSDEIAARIEAGKTIPATFAEACAMSKEDYLVYNQKLSCKMIWATGVDEAYWFENAQTKGLVEIGKSPGNREQGHVLLGSLDGGKVVGCWVTARAGKLGDAGKMIEQIAATFVFTIDNIGDTDEIKRRISAAGIGK